MDRPKRVPERHVGVVVKAFGAMHLTIKAEVLTVHVLKTRGHLQRVIQRGAENPTLTQGATRDFDPGQLLFPSRDRDREPLIEIQLARFLIEVGTCVRDAHVRYRQFEFDHLRGFVTGKTEIHTDVITLGDHFATVFRRTRPGPQILNSPIATGDKIDLQSPITF